MPRASRLPAFAFLAVAALAGCVRRPRAAATPGTIDTLRVITVPSPPRIDPARAEIVPPTLAPAESAALVARRVPNSVHWARNSAEHRALLLQTYRAAGEQLARLAAGRPTGSWAVILDADETVLDNSSYQRERALLDSGYTAASWEAYVRQARSPALPGAAQFVARAKSLGGRVVIVTNREEAVCDATRQNFRAIAIPFDQMLCKPPGVEDKTPRFRAVAAGAAPSTLGPLQVLMWVGDNIQDFPDLTQAIGSQPDAAFEQFGRTYIVLPNPMYGSWERGERR